MHWRTSNPDNTIREASWDEHIHFNLDTSLNSNELTITCLDASMKSPEARLGKITESLANFDKLDEVENKSKRSYVLEILIWENEILIF